MSEKLDDETRWSMVTIGIPPELSGYESDFKRFFDAMIFKMRRNAHRGKWEDVPLKDALEGLQGEVNELGVAVTKGNTLEIWTEAADSANMALIVAAIALEAQGV